MLLLSMFLDLLSPKLFFNFSFWIWEVVLFIFQFFINRIEDDLDKLLSVKAKPQKPPKPSLPVAKPRLKPKPNLKPKPTPKPRFVEAAAGENELFGSEDAEATEQKTKETSAAKGKPGSEDLFDQARKHTFRYDCSVIVSAFRLSDVKLYLK